MDGVRVRVARQSIFGSVWALGAVVLLGTLGGCAVWSGKAFENPDTTKPGFVAASNTLPEDASATQELEVLESQRTPIDHEHSAVASATTLVFPPPANPRPIANYILGANDVLFVSVTGQPELSTPAPRAGGLNAIGSRIDGNGYVQLPMVGTVKVGGLTTHQAQLRIEKSLKTIIKNPTVVVEVIQFRSQPVYMVGKFKSPGVIYMDRPTTLIQGIAVGGGMEIEQASLRSARVQRNGRVIPVDIYKLLCEGDMSQNIWLHPYDTVFIPDTLEQRVFMLGDVETPGQVNMIHGRLTLLEAISKAGGFKREGSQLKRVRVIRPVTPTTGEIIVLNLDKILKGEALDFPLKAGDVVYIPRSDLGTWNDMMAEILPTLRVLSAVLDPFVILAAF